jgi:replicative DNA helicase
MSASLDGKGNREQEISTISRSLKALAKELDVPVIALSQLSREVEKRQSSSKKPILSDLRESGAIEQDADVVVFIYRPDYYKLSEEDEKDAAEIIIAKHRNGPLKEIKLRFISNFAKFEDYSSGSVQPLQDVYPNTEFGNGITTIQRSSKMNDEPPF